MTRRYRGRQHGYIYQPAGGCYALHRSPGPSTPARQPAGAVRKTQGYSPSPDSYQTQRATIPSTPRRWRSTAPGYLAVSHRHARMPQGRWTYAADARSCGRARLIWPCLLARTGHAGLAVAWSVVARAVLPVRVMTW